MRSSEKAEAWLGLVPAQVADKAHWLLDQVGRMRSEQTIYPTQDEVLNALAYTGPVDVKAVIVGQDPYHEPHQAMGLAFSVPEGEKLPPSLRNVYKELAADLGCPVPVSGDLTPWAEQGVLLLNTSLTVREHAAASHAKLGWQVLTSAIVRACFDLPQPVAFLAWGRHAMGLIEGAREEAAGSKALASKFVLASTHPSPLSASRAAGGLPAFLGSRPFSRANDLLVSAGSTPVAWDCLR